MAFLEVPQFSFGSFILSHHDKQSLKISLQNGLDLFKKVITLHTWLSSLTAEPLGILRHQSRTAVPRPLEPIATIEDAGIILFRWFCLQQFFNFTHHRLHHTMPSTTTHVFYNIEPLPSQAEVLSFLWHFSDGCVRGADVKHLRSRDGRTRQGRPSRWALC